MIQPFSPENKKTKPVSGKASAFQRDFPQSEFLRRTRECAFGTEKQTGGKKKK